MPRELTEEDWEDYRMQATEARATRGVVRPSRYPTSIMSCLALVTAAHRARLEERGLLATESLARSAGATHTQIAAAVARGWE